jgi:hypothetical protein
MNTSARPHPLTTIRQGLVVLVRPLLTFAIVTVRRWGAAWTQKPAIVMPPHWRARQRYEEGRHGDRG